MSDIQVSKLKVAELKQLLQERGLDTKGNKPDLVARLQEALDNEKQQQNDESAEIDVGDGKDSKLSNAAQDKEESVDVDVLGEQDIDITGEGEETVKSTKTTAANETDKLKLRAARFGLPVSLTNDPEKKKLRAERFGLKTRPSLASSEQQLQRALRFGIPVNAAGNKEKDGTLAAKKEARALRFGTSSGIAKSTNKVWSAEDQEKKRKRLERFANNAPQAKKQKVEDEDVDIA